MAEFRFTNETRPNQIGTIMGTLEKPRLWIPATDYPDYFEWLGKVETELGNNTKRAMVAHYGSETVGTIIYQRHKELDEAVEIKNISVTPDARGRYIGSFMLRNVEIEATQFDYPDTKDVIVDTKSSNIDMITFLLRQHYRISAVDDLYGHGAGSDVILIKDQTTN